MTCDQSPRPPLGHSATRGRHVRRPGPRSLLAAEISGARTCGRRPARVTSFCGFPRTVPSVSLSCPRGSGAGRAARPERLLNLLLNGLRWVWWRLGTLLCDLSPPLILSCPTGPGVSPQLMEVCGPPSPPSLAAPSHLPPRPLEALSPPGAGPRPPQPARSRLPPRRCHLCPRPAFVLRPCRGGQPLPLAALTPGRLLLAEGPGSEGARGRGLTWPGRSLSASARGCQLLHGPGPG